MGREGRGRVKFRRLGIPGYPGAVKRGRGRLRERRKDRQEITASVSDIYNSLLAAI